MGNFSKAQRLLIPDGEERGDTFYIVYYSKKEVIAVIHCSFWLQEGLGEKLSF